MDKDGLNLDELHEIARKAVRQLAAVTHQLASAADDDFDKCDGFGMAGTMEAGGMNYKWEFKISNRPVEEEIEDMAGNAEALYEEWSRAMLGGEVK